MNIRKLEKDERFDSMLISTYCFHGRIEDMEKARERAIASETDDWGAFNDDGVLMAHVLNNRFFFNIDGTTVKSGGIGGVSTLPEYRREGAVSEIFKALLEDAYRGGEVISCLYPFNQGFYRKQGYEVAAFENEYELEPAFLEGYTSDCDAVMWRPGDSAKEHLKVYTEFIKGFNLAMPRDEEAMLEHIRTDEPYRDRKFTYLFQKDGRSAAYLIFTDIRHDPAAILRVEECAWTGRDGFEAILAFLGRFDADYGTIQLPLPYGIDLLRVVRTRRAYQIRRSSKYGYMVRAVNAEALLRVIRKPSGCDFTIRIADDILRENNGVWRVTENEVLRVAEDTVADIEVSEQSFAQMAVGAVGWDEALLKPDVTVNANEETLRNVFTEKKLLIYERF